MPVKADKVKILTKIALISFLLCSCTAKQPHSEETIEVDIYQPPAKQTDFIDDWRHVILETNDDQALIGDITSFDIDEDHILIVSDRQDIFLYDHDGKLISAFNRRGQGPNEYHSSFDAKLFDGYIWVMCRGSHQLIKYDSTGHGIKSFTLPDAYFNFNFLDDNKVILSSNRSCRSPYDFIIYDIVEDRTIAKLFNYDINDDHYAIGPLAYQPFIGNADNKLCFIRLYDYNIYNLNSDYNLYSSRLYHFNTPFQPNDYADKSYEDMREAAFRDQGIEYLGNAYYDENISFQSFHLSIDHRAKDFVYRYDSATGQGDLIDCTITEEFPFLALPPLAFYDGWYITALTPENIEFVENKFGKKYVDGIDEDSNPVLFFHHFR